MKSLSILLLTLLISCSLFAQQERHSKIKIYTGDEGLLELSSLGIAVDHGEYKKGVFFISDLSQSEIKIVKNAGFSYDIIHADVAAFYQQRSLQSLEKEDESVGCEPVVPNFEVPENFELGSMAGFFTYDEMLTHLDFMSTNFNQIITVRQEIGTFRTHEDRPIFWIKISDNPNFNDDGEPEMLYTALHHAREPMSMSQLIFYMYYLLENYGIDEDVTNLVNNTELYFIPCLNPDGYNYNQETNPNGFGFWRKNMKDNDGDFDFSPAFDGVDLNRNYGYEWGYDDDGSSPNISSNTYRGTEGFSEPETRAMKYFCENHEFSFCLNYHSFSNVLIYPWAFNATVTEDDLLYKAFSQVMTRDNKYPYGTITETLGYIGNGGSDDWLHGEQDTKNKIFSFTPEVGTPDDGFWPAQSRIIPLALENVWQNLTTARLMLNYARVLDTAPEYVQNYEWDANFELQRLGLREGGSFTVSIEPISSNITSVGDPKTFTGLELLESAVSSITLNISETIAQGEAIAYNLVIDNGEGLILRETINKYFGIPTLVFEETGDNIDEWLTPPMNGWGVSFDQFVSESSSITDSPIGDYSDNNTNTLTLTSPIDLSDALQASLTFWAKWDIESNYDYVQLRAVDIVTGVETPLCGKYTQPGTDNQLPDEPIYDGVQANWVLEKIDLSDFVGTLIQLKFVLDSDGAVNGDGYYFDDLTVQKITDNSTAIQTPIPSTLSIQVAQNFPNPVNSFTTISYYLPDNQTGNRLVIFNSLGQQVREMVLPNVRGEGQIRLDVSDLTSGVYFYQIGTKQTFSALRKMVVMGDK